MARVAIWWNRRQTDRSGIGSILEHVGHAPKLPTMPRSVTQNSTDDILINHRSVSSSVSLLLFQFEDCICLTTLFMLSPTTMVLSLFSPDKKKDADVVSQVSVGGLSRPTELRAWVRRCGEGGFANCTASGNTHEGSHKM